MPAADLRQVLNLFRVLWLPAIPLATALIIGAGMFFPKQRQSIRESVAAIRNDSGLAALGALALFPVAISIISFKQPALLPRYSIVTFLAWAPLVAIAAQSVGRIPRLLIAGGLALVISGTVLNVQQQHLSFARSVATGR